VILIGLPSNSLTNSRKVERETVDWTWWRSGLSIWIIMSKHAVCRWLGDQTWAISHCCREWPPHPGWNPVHRKYDVGNIEQWGTTNSLKYCEKIETLWTTMWQNASGSLSGPIWFQWISLFLLIGLSDTPGSNRTIIVDNGFVSGINQTKIDFLVPCHPKQWIKRSESTGERDGHLRTENWNFVEKWFLG
jgi:hypothetical protein